VARKMNKLLRKPKVQYMGNIGHKRQTQIAKLMSNTDPTKVPEMNTGVHELMVTFSRKGIYFFFQNPFSRTAAEKK
jgi:uncharacterized protein YaaN involved in tellurite resistance